MKQVILCICLSVAVPFLNGQDLQTVLNKNSEALGLESRNNIQYLETKGHAVMAGTDAKIPFKMLQSKPDLLRIETLLFGFKAIQTYDGVSAWILSPTSGMEAIKADARDMEFIAAATAIDGPFSVNKNEKYTLVYGGKDTYQDKNVQIILWKADEERLKYFINEKSWLIDGLRYEYKKNGAWYSMEYRILSYLDFQGSKFPEKITTLINGVEMVSLQITGLKEVDEPDKEDFGKPSYQM